MSCKRIVIGIIILTVAIFVFNSVHLVKEALPTSAQLYGQPSVIVDAGHGGFDGGAEGTGGTKEKNINLAISLKLRDMLSTMGVNVIMIRDSDLSVEDDGFNTIRKKKVSDIHNRLKIMEDNPSAIVVSIHQNKFTQSQYWGAQVFYGVKQKEQGAALAQIIQENICNYLQPENKRKIKEGYKSIYLLQNAPNIMVMVECGFLSNGDELRKLTDPDYQGKLAVVIAASVLEFIK